MGMLPFLIAGLAGLAILIIAVGVAMSGGSGGVASRLERYASGREPSEDGGERESAVTAGIGRALDRQGLTARLAVELARADLKLRPSEYVTAWAASPFVFVAVSYALGLVLPGFGNPVTLAVMAFLVGIYAPRFYLKYRQGKRLKEFGTQLPDTITLLANSLRAGSSFLQGVELVTREARPPISEEFERVVREMSLGVALQPALTNLSRRVASEDVELMVTAINIQSQVGGNLATVLDSIAYTIRERIRIQGEIQTLTAMQRYSGYVITLLPVGLAGTPVPDQPQLHQRDAAAEPTDLWAPGRHRLLRRRSHQHGHRLHADPAHRRYQGVRLWNRRSSSQSWRPLPSCSSPTASPPARPRMPSRLGWSSSSSSRRRWRSSSSSSRSSTASCGPSSSDSPSSAAAATRAASSHARMPSWSEPGIPAVSVARTGWASRSWSRSWPRLASSSLAC